MTRGIAGFEGKRVGILGLAASGRAAGRALLAAGAKVLAFDDDPVKRAEARSLGFEPGSDADIPDLACLVVSPGVPLTHPAPHHLVAAAKAAGVAITGDIQLFKDGLGPRPLIGVTGTNGKSTTTALIHHLLVRAGRDAAMGGNIGRAVFELEAGPEDRLFVLEFSSFQLDLCHDVACRIAVLLNIAPDHLDRHGDLEGYIAAKRRILDQQDPDGAAVIGVDDPWCREIAGEVAEARRCVTVSVTGPADVAVKDGVIVDRLDGAARRVGSLAGIETLRGRHNHQNAAAAYAACRLLGLDAEEAMAGMASFAGLPHRMEEVARIGPVRFVNDSKATNPDAAMSSLGAFPRIHWIAGGRAKPGGFAGLLPHLACVRRAYLIGEAAEALAGDLGEALPVERSATLDRAVAAAYERAAREAAEGDEVVVLLAPACASFDQFRSFEARGDAFRAMVHDLAAGHEALGGAA